MVGVLYVCKIKIDEKSKATKMSSQLLCLADRGCLHKKKIKLSVTQLLDSTQKKILKIIPRYWFVSLIYIC